MIQQSFIDMENMFDLLKEKQEVNNFNVLFTSFAYDFTYEAVVGRSRHFFAGI